MKFGYRDRIILLIVCVVVIFAVGIFVFIKPKWEELNRDQDQLKTVQETWDKQVKNYDQITTRQGVITKKYEDAKTISENFTDTMSSVEMEEFLRNEFLNIEKFKTDEVQIRDSFAVSDESSATLSYYYYTPNVVTYPLLENADLDGSLAKTAQEKRKEVDFLAARSSQAVGSGTASFTLRINREDTMALLDAVKAYAEKSGSENAMLITSVQLKDCDFNEDLKADNKGNANANANAGEGEGDAQVQAGNNNNTGETADGEKPGYTDVIIEYRAYYVQEPTQPYTGDPYDPKIWNGNEWRTKVAQ
ncbi:MAG: hypothetical protein IJ060_05770 [Oscillospiraceae bacterium]|nr:hypothetical protein [Oscillospiraceae bacterium]